MATRQSSLDNPLAQHSSLNLLKKSTQKTDNTFATARSLGVLRASSSPTKFTLKGSLSKRDRDDFVKLEVAPGVAFSSITNVINVKGGSLKVDSYFQFPGLAPQKVNSVKFSPGQKTQVSNSPFSNSFGISVQLFIQIRSLSPSKDIFYNSGITFKP